MVYRSAAFGTFLRTVGCATDTRTDARLLADFYAHRDEPAFATLVRRYQRTVWSVCARTLTDPADAEDAFQATFLVLARSGRMLTDRGSVGGWLYRVAERVARKARTMTIRRKRREQRARRPEAVTDRTPDDLFDVVSDELGRLPEGHRLAVVLCDLDGLSRSDAAAQLGWPEGTLSTRLHRGRKELGERLRARGVTTPLVGLAAVFATSTVPVRAAEAVVELACIVTEIGLTDRAVPPSVAALVSQTTKEMAMRITTKFLATLTLATGVLGFGWLGLPGGMEPRATAAPVPEMKKDAKPDLSRTGLELLRNRKVLKALNCTAEQRAAIEDSFDDFQDGLRDTRLQMVAQLRATMLPGGQPNAAQEAQFKAELDQQMNNGLEAVKAAVAKALQPSQLLRLGQIDLQTRWAEVFTDPKIVEELKLTDEQKTQIDDAVKFAKDAIQNQNFVPVKGAGEGMVFVPDGKGGSGGFEKVEAVLTKEQKATWTKRAGEPIDFEKLNLYGANRGYSVRMIAPAPVVPPAKNGGR